VKRILFSVMTIAIVGALIGGGVFAYFSDVESSPDNSFTAGTLDLSVDNENPWTSTKITVSNMAPGADGVATMTLTNEGTIDGTLTVDLKNLSDTEGENPEPEINTTEPGDLSANMDIALWVDANHDGVQDGGETVLYSGKLNAEAGPYSVGTLAASATTYVSLNYSIDSGVGNDIQGDISTFDIEFNLTQVP